MDGRTDTTDCSILLANAAAVNISAVKQNELVAAEAENTAIRQQQQPTERRRPTPPRTKAELAGGTD